MERNELLWMTIIIRMPLSMAVSWGKCWSPHCVLTPYASRTNTSVDVRGEMASHSRWRWSNGEVSDAAECAPVSPKSVQLSRCSHNTMYFPLHSPQIQPMLWGEAGFARLAVVSNQLQQHCQPSLWLSPRGHPVLSRTVGSWVSTELRRQRSHL